MKKYYHYEYYWQCVDMCNGGAKTHTYRKKFIAMWYKPEKGIWQLRKKRVDNMYRILHPFTEI